MIEKDICCYDYNAPGVYGYEQAADILYRLESSQKDIERLYRRMVFNVMARNQDDHVKNIAFLMDKKGKWRLSPAYDVTYACDTNNYWLARHQMSVNGKLESITNKDLQECAKKMNIGKRRADKIIDEVRFAVENWQLYAEQSYIRGVYGYSMCGREVYGKIS